MNTAIKQLADLREPAEIETFLQERMDKNLGLVIKKVKVVNGNSGDIVTASLHSTTSCVELNSEFTDIFNELANFYYIATFTCVAPHLLIVASWHLEHA